MTATGAIVMSFFAAVWWVAGLWAFGHGSALLYAFGVLLSAALIIAGSRVRATLSPREQSRRRRLVGIASGAEGVLLFVSANILLNTGDSSFIAPVAAIIVGLHFLPLARWMPAPLYYFSAALLVALGLVGFMIAGTEQRGLLVCLGAAGVLWLTSIALLRNTYAPAQSAAARGV